MILSLDQMNRLEECFSEIKAENDPLLQDSLEEAFVPTEVYDSVNEAKRCLLVGRKGVGKTALLLGYKSRHEEVYVTETPIAITADEFPLETLFNFFYKRIEERSRSLGGDVPAATELPGIIEPSRVAAFAWKNSLIASAVYFAGREILANKRDDDDPHHLETVEEAVGEVDQWLSGEAPRSGQGSELIHALLVYFFGVIDELIDESIQSATGGLATLLGAIIAKVTRRLRQPGGAAVERAVASIGYLLENRERRALITLDRFDDFYDNFYKNQIRFQDFKERQEFLRILLEGLIVSTREISRDAVLGWLDCLFTIPVDKFLEIHLRERADLEQSNVIKINWQPKELYDFVGRRIRIALNLKDSVADPWDRVFPLTVANRTVSEVKEDSFLYLLRHTLWKPRELQIYITALLREMKKSGGEATEEMFQRVVRDHSQEIIRQEFEEEFQAEFPMIREVLNKLEGVTLYSVMPYQDVCDSVSGTRLSDGVSSPKEIVLRLYHMGVLGVRQVVAGAAEAATGVIRQNKASVKYIFCYSSMVHDPFGPSSAVAFHPMFFEYLNIIHREAYVVNELRWHSL